MRKEVNVTLSPKFGLSHWKISEEAMRNCLSRFGEVVKYKRCHHEEWSNVENGYRHALMVLEKPLPSLL